MAAILAAVALLASNASAADWNCADRDKHTLDRTQPLNIGQLKLQLLDYKYCGGYEQEFAERIAEAKAYIQLRAKQVSKPALVLDIDETSLSNWLQMAQDDFGYINQGACTLKPHEPCGATAWQLEHTAPVLKPTLDLFNTARKLDVTVFFVTGRSDRPDLRTATANNLKAVGYDGYADLIMRPEDSGGPVRIFKTAARKTIAAQGFTIIANVGDQQSDLDGGYAEQPFKLPNPFYFIP